MSQGSKARVALHTPATQEETGRVTIGGEPQVDSEPGKPIAIVKV